MKIKKTMKRTSLLAVSAVLVGMTAVQWDVHASQMSDYEERMLAGFEYDQNNFEEVVSKRMIEPKNLTIPTPFTAGVKYNAYQPKGNAGSQMTIGELGATDEEAITTSFWLNLKQDDTVGIMPFSIGSYTLYQIEGRFGFNTFNHDVYGVDLSRTSGNWVHVIATFHKDDFYKNTLYLNGKKQTLSHSGAPLNGEPRLTSATWNAQSVVNMAGHPTYSLKQESMIDEFQVLSGKVTDTDAQNLFTMSRVPELNAFQENNKAKLEWAVSTFNPNPFYKTSFEPGEDMPRVPNDKYKTVSLASPDSYNGGNAVEFAHTTDLRGNGYYYPSTTSNRSTFNFTERKYVPNGTPVSVSFKAKATERAVVQPSGIGGAASSTIDHHLIYGGSPKVFLEDAPAGSRVIKVSNVDELPVRPGVWVADRYIPVPQHEGPFYSYAEIEKIDVENNLIYLTRRGLAEDFKAGQLLQGHRSVNPITFPSQVVPGDGEWKNININTTVRDYDHFDTMIRGFLLYFYVETAGTMQIDDVELIEATRSELYRGDKLVYSGYNSQYVDNEAIDKIAPGKATVKTVEMNHDVAKVTLLKPKDYGSDYEYKMRGVTSDGTQTIFSNPEKVTITSGVKGYSYSVDTNPSTIPNATVNTSSEVISIPRPVQDGTRYLHVRTIDNQGNAGETTHIKLSAPTLTADASADNTYADLSWTFDQKDEPFEYKVYKRKQGESVFQSISTFDESSSEQLNTLLVYPTKSCSKEDIPLETFTDSSGNQKTLPKSASLEAWMEEPNKDNPKGYGKGLIEVDSVSGDEFNLQHATILKNTKGEFVYDSVVFGIWDCHGQDTLSDASYQSLIPFLEDGRGVLLGHDSVYSDVRRKNYLNIGKNYGNIDMMPAGYNKQFRSSDIEIVREGILTRYPWNLGGVGTKLNVPLTHTSYQKFSGDTWMRWALPPISGQTQQEYEQTNVFLHSWNNVAMVQSGHSNGEATEDEQKILANTLFYMAQKTTDTSLKDFSSVDDSMPDKVNNPLYKRNADGRYTAEFSPVKDNGTSYEYYVEAIGKVSGSTYFSSIKGTEILSGMKGYAIEVSTSEVPTVSVVQKNSAPLTFDVPASTRPGDAPFFVHLKAIDAVGNQSVHTTRYESSIAYLVITPSITGWTNKSVTLTIQGSQGIGAITSLRMPDGSVINSPKTTFVVSENGYYPFYGKDEFGQWMSGGFTVTNIDKETPIGQVPNLPTGWATQDIDIQIDAE